MANLFVFEGPDGVGKTTVISLVEKQLQESGVACTQLAFPGNELGTLGDHIYKLHHLSESFGVRRISPTSLQLLHVAAHIDAIEQRILPLLNGGTTILLDRYWWSTWVYGTASGVPEDQVKAMLDLERLSWKSTRPKVIFLFRRSNVAGDPVLVNAYDRLAKMEKDSDRIVTVDNDDTPDLVAERIVRIVLNELAEEPLASRRQ